MSVDYHGWTHRPKAQGGTDPIEIPGSDLPGFHAHLTTSHTLTTANDTVLLFDEWTMDGAAGEFFNEGALSGGRLEGFRLVQEGWYSLNCWIDWSTNPASGFAGIMMLDFDNDWFVSPIMQGVTYPLNWHLDTVQTFNIVRYYPSVYWHDEDPEAPLTEVEFWAVHNAGVNRTIAEAGVEIVYLGARAT